jgi:hypothetical protein
MDALHRLHHGPTQLPRARAALVLALLVATIGVVLAVMMLIARPATCTSLELQKWENASIDPVPVYAERNEKHRRSSIESGETFRPSARCGEWLEVPISPADPPVYVRVDAVEHVA